MKNNQLQRKAPSMGSLLKVAFGLCIGSMLATITFLLLVAAVKKQHKLPKDQRKNTLLITGYVVIAIGTWIGLGFGASVLLSLLGEDL